MGGSRFSPVHDDSDNGFESQRTRLLLGTQQLEDQSRRLENSHRIALETGRFSPAGDIQFALSYYFISSEEIGAGVLTNLRSQREQIQHANQTVGLDINIPVIC